MLGQVTQALELAQAVAQMIPLVGGMVGGAIQICNMILRLAKDAKTLREDLVKFADRAARITLAVLEIARESPPERLITLEPRIADLIRTLRLCHMTAQKAVVAGPLRRMFGLCKLQEELAECNGQLEEAVMLFGIRSQFAHNNTLLELKDISLQSDRRISDIAQSISSMEISLRTQDAYDREFQYFRLCDFEIMETFSEHREVNLQHEYHLVRRHGTQDRFVMKRYSPTDARTHTMLQSLKVIRHANIQQLIGYSRPGSQMPFYIVYSGQRPFTHTMRSLTYRERIRLFIKTAESMTSGMSFLTKRVYTSAINPSLNIFNMYINLSLGSRSSALTSNVSFSPWLDQTEKIVLDIPDAVEEERRHFHSQIFDGLRTFYSPIESSVCNPANCTDYNEFLAWVNLLDTWVAAYEAPLHPSWCHRPGQGVIHVTLARLVGGVFLPLWTEPIYAHSVEHMTYLDKHGYRQAVGGDIVCYHHEYANLKIRYTLSCFEGRPVKAEIRRSWVIPSHNWQKFAQDVLDLAEHFNLEPSEVCAPCRVFDCSYWSLAGDTVGHTFPPPKVLYFWMHPATEIGPLPLESGYWSLDEEGFQISSIVHSGWDEQYHEWYAEHDLCGLRLCMRREIRVQYMRFKEEEIEMLREYEAIGTEGARLSIEY